MSDPVTNMEIEDVLSSIRRLVSAEERGEKTETAAEPEAQKAEEKLVLTPAQRVDEVSASELPSQEDWAEEPEIEAASLSDAEVRLDEVEETENAEPTDAPVDSDAHDTVPELPEFLTRRHSELHDAANAVAREEKQEAAELDDAQESKAAELTEALDEAQDEFAREENQESAEPDETQEAEAAELEEALDEAQDEVAREENQEAAEPDETQETEAAELEEALNEPQDDAEAEQEPELEAEADDEADLDDLEVALSDIEARAAEFEEAIAGKDEVWEPDGVSSDDYSGHSVEPLPWSEMDEALEAQEAETAAEQSQAEADEGGEDPWYEDDTVLDEDALRDMVSEIVRQELQGELGERITRNVRKLVRREISRALMSQGIE